MALDCIPQTPSAGAATFIFDPSKCRVAPVEFINTAPAIKEPQLGSRFSGLYWEMGKKKGSGSPPMRSLCRVLCGGGSSTTSRSRSRAGRTSAQPRLVGAAPPVRHTPPDTWSTWSAVITSHPGPDTLPEQGHVPCALHRGTPLVVVREASEASAGYTQQSRWRLGGESLDSSQRALAFSPFF